MQTLIIEIACRKGWNTPAGLHYDTLSHDLQVASCTLLLTNSFNRTFLVQLFQHKSLLLLLPTKHHSCN
jgi:hypothetical protein